MPGPHPRRRLVRDDVLLQRRHVWDWAPSGWHWEVLPSGAAIGAEGAGPRGGSMSPCQGGGRARPSLHGCVGRQVLQYLAGSLGISPEL